MSYHGTRAYKTVNKKFGMFQPMTQADSVPLIGEDIIFSFKAMFEVLVSVCPLTVLKPLVMPVKTVYKSVCPESVPVIKPHDATPPVAPEIITF